MSVQQLGRVWVALTLACATGACASSTGGVRAWQPHGVVKISIAHEPNADAGGYIDSVFVDGLRYDVDRHGQLLLRLSPGKHEVELVSAKAELRLRLSTVDSFASICSGFECGTQIVQTSNDALGLASEAGTECSKMVVLDVSKGEQLTANLTYAVDGTCSGG